MIHGCGETDIIFILGSKLQMTGGVGQLGSHDDCDDTHDESRN